MDVITQGIILLGLIFLSGLFSGSETAIVAISRFTVRQYVKEQRPGSKYLVQLKEHPHKTLSTILICNNVVNISSSVIAANIALELFSSNPLALATAIMTIFILIFGEVVPKNFASSHPGFLSLTVAPTVYFIGIFLTPAILILDFITKYVFRIKTVRHKLSEEELKGIIEVAREEGGIDKEEKDMIQRIFKIDDLTVDNVKIPRIDMVSLPKGTTLMEALSVTERETHSRIPIYDGAVDSIVGIFYLKDALKKIQKKELSIPVEKIMREPLIVPESKKLDEMLKLFQSEGQQMAIIVNEHGEVAGLITLEDILEEIVGDITDETEKQVEKIQKIKNKEFKVLGSTAIAELNQGIGTKLPESEEYDTLSGYLLQEFGSIPKKGEVYESYHAVFTVQRIFKNRVYEVKVKKK